MQDGDTDNEGYTFAKFKILGPYTSNTNLSWKLHEGLDAAIRYGPASSIYRYAAEIHEKRLTVPGKDPGNPESKEQMFVTVRNVSYKEGC